MFITSDKKFNKKFEKLPKKIKQKFLEKMDVFEINPFEKVLNNHKLNGKYDGCNSINVTGDYRAVYRIDIGKKGEEFCIFVTIGTHTELYE